MIIFQLYLENCLPEFPYIILSVFLVLYVLYYVNQPTKRLSKNNYNITNQLRKGQFHLLFGANLVINHMLNSTQLIYKYCQLGMLIRFSAYCIQEVARSSLEEREVFCLLKVRRKESALSPGGFHLEGMRVQEMK